MAISDNNLPPLLKANLILLLLVLIFSGLYFARAFLIPLTFAGILAMLMAPLAQKLEISGVPKPLASLVCILILVSILAGIGVIISTQVASFAEDLPQIENQLNEHLVSLQTFVQETLGISPQEQKEAVQQDESSGMSSLAVNALGSFTSILASFLLVLVYMFLLLYYRTRFPKFVMKVVSEEEKERARKIIADSSDVAQQYLVGRGILILILATLYSIGLSIIGLDNAIFLSVLASLLSIIPYVGNILGVILLLFMGLTQDDGSSIIFGILIVFSVVQFIESYILEPYVVGAEVDIHPFFTVVIIIVGELIWGVAGMILAIPLLGIVKIIFSNIESLEPYAFLIGDTRDNGESENVMEKFNRWFSS